MNFCAIDFGHTNYKIAYIENKDIVSIKRYSYQENAILDELNILFKNFKCSKILCASVLNYKVIDSIVSSLPAEMKSILKFFNSSDCLKYINLAYKNDVYKLGIDRALGLVSASTKTNKDLIVIDAGTATSIDYLDLNRNHIGGIILPGKKIIDSIFYEMLNFDFFEEDFFKNIFSKNTRSCIENGSLISAYASIDTVLDRMISTKDVDVEIFLTGGNFREVIDNCNYSMKHVESLLFDGLVVLDGS